MSTDKPAKSASIFADASGQWVSACFKPWSSLAGWSIFWGDQWKQWLSAICAQPNPWLPALASERVGQPAVIDFFLPWLPRAEATSGTVDAVNENDAVRAMLRAAVPHVGAGRGAAEAGQALGTSHDMAMPGRDVAPANDLHMTGRGLVSEGGKAEQRLAGTQSKTGLSPGRKAAASASSTSKAPAVRSKKKIESTPGKDPVSR